MTEQEYGDLTNLTKIRNAITIVQNISSAYNTITKKEIADVIKRLEDMRIKCQKNINVTEDKG